MFGVDQKESIDCMGREFGNIDLSYEYLLGKLKSFEMDRDDLRILDVGTNMGSLPYRIYKEMGIYADGVDIDEDSIRCGKENYFEISDHLWAVGSDLKRLKSESYDVVTMFDVIEHIPNVKEYLKEEVFRILKRGGLLVFQTPNARINPIFETIQSRSFTRWKKWHCSLQTPGSLVKELQSAGFADIVVEKYRLDSEYNRTKLKKYVGRFTTNVLISCFQKMPLAIYPNLWGVAVKPENLSRD